MSSEMETIMKRVAAKKINGGANKNRCQSHEIDNLGGKKKKIDMKIVISSFHLMNAKVDEVMKNINVIKMNVTL